MFKFLLSIWDNQFDYFDFNFLLYTSKHDQQPTAAAVYFLSRGLDKREDTTDYHSLGTVLALKTGWVAKHHDLTGPHTNLVLQVDMLNMNKISSLQSLPIVNTVIDYNQNQWVANDVL